VYKCICHAAEFPHEAIVTDLAGPRIKPQIFRNKIYKTILNVSDDGKLKYVHFQFPRH